MPGELVACHHGAGVGNAESVRKSFARMYRNSKIAARIKSFVGLFQAKAKIKQ